MKNFHRHLSFLVKLYITTFIVSIIFNYNNADSPIGIYIIFFQIFVGFLGGVALASSHRKKSFAPDHWDFFKTLEHTTCDVCGGRKYNIFVCPQGRMGYCSKCGYPEGGQLIFGDPEKVKEEFERMQKIKGEL